MELILLVESNVVTFWVLLLTLSLASVNIKHADRGT
jgi:hypothetical protein